MRSVRTIRSIVSVLGVLTAVGMPAGCSKGGSTEIAKPSESAAPSTSAEPVRAVSVAPVYTAVSAQSFNVCAINQAGGVVCWSYDAWEKLGHVPTETSAAPMIVEGLESGVVAISAGSRDVCALTSAGSVKCWESADNREEPKPIKPIQVPGLESGVKAVSAGGEHNCVLMVDGAVKCWGSNELGQLGDGTRVDRDVPTQVKGLTSNVIAVSAGGEHTCVLVKSGGVKCWGSETALG
ncbi:MAG: hypothetical protein FWD57_16915, partial [Polyangiaceae bacterium]|nr:hypothetical protein [Polyangiaceae bacterium]